MAKKSTVKKKKISVTSVVETPVATAPQEKKPPVIMKVLIGIVLLVGVVLLFVSSQPTRYIITQQITIEAPAAKVMGEVNDFHNWVDWSPWEKMDPSIKRTYEKPDTGVGAVCNWVGNESVGTGKMVITESDSDHINVELDYQFPPIGKLFYRFDFTPNNKETLVSWQ
ncbi:MAG TPA: SRPBCC family protein, partial [bacterium]|nr:SRPBCC family protein [bacterium]